MFFYFAVEGITRRMSFSEVIGDSSSTDIGAGCGRQGPD
jgi:hypothetical protein